mmetsp:Transcript_2723/g.5255  ORF Transcript_2723/g.5255 Transcript_2723/m.5255 type:complete len:346 (+) Transcript_2723:137-1174(+)
MKIVHAITALVFALPHARAQVNICSSDIMCGFLGGSCLSGTSPDYQCDKRFLFKTFCGASESCQCCTKLSCEETATCSLYGGSCNSEANCALMDSPHRWVAGLCSDNPFLDAANCGCCIPVNPPTPQPTSFPTLSPTPAPTQCPSSDACSANGGECLPMQTCPLSQVWDPLLCSGGVGTLCGCCYSPGDTTPSAEPAPAPSAEPAPAPTASAGVTCGLEPSCLAGAGYCVYDSDSCNGTFVEFGCSGEGCHCCMTSPPPTTSPSPFYPSPVPSSTGAPTAPVCTASPECVEHMGWCMSNADSATDCIMPDYEFDPEGCSGPDCGCCRMPSSSPPSSSPPTTPPSV